MIEDLDEFKSIRKELNINNIFEKAFSYLPKLVVTEDDFERLMTLVFQNFIDDNVTYLEIRSSPKRL